MDGGIDYSLSRKIFHGIEHKVKSIVQNLGIKNLLGRNYLPIGSSIIVDSDNNNKSLIVSPTMLLPQDVSQTRNAYYATMVILYNILINRKYNIDNVNIIFTSICCGFGKMSAIESFNQIMQGIKDYHSYQPQIINSSIIIKEPKLYQNTEWFNINVYDIN